MDLQMIKKYCESRPGGVKQLAKDIGMSEPNLHRCIRLNQIQARDLEKIANVLNIDICDFFDNHGGAASRAVETTGDFSPASYHGDVTVGGDAVLAERVKALESEIQARDQLLTEKERLIQVLMEKR